MRRFILRSSLFATITSVVLMCIWLGAYAGRANVIDKDAIILFLGTSRIQYTIDPTDIPHTFQWGNNGESYFWTLQKLRLILRHNRHVRTVILGCDGPSLTFSFNNNDERQFLPYYFGVLTKEDWLHIMQNRPDALRALFDWHQILLPYKAYLHHTSVTDIDQGGYSPLYRDKLATDIQEREKDNIDDSVFEPSTEQTTYLDEIIALCKEKNIKVILLTVPSYPTADYAIRNKKMNRYIYSRYPDIEHWDYEFIQMPDSCYGDIDHVNYRGADIFSGIINNRLKASDYNP